jgi:acetolactate synthase I/II/III large subunit
MNQPVETPIQATANFWNEYGADEWTDAVVASMKLGGIDHMFFVSGTELAYYQEAVVKAGVKNWPAPQLVTMIHESAALHAAIGAAMVSGKPSAACAHVDVGTLHYGAAIHTAWRANAPVLITAGNAPRAFPGSMRGARNMPVQWLQEPRDQSEILRQYTKADHRIEYQDNPGLMISRLLQLAMSAPKGPVYMSMPREIAMLPYPGSVRFPTCEQLGLARPVAPQTEDARTIARWLVQADNPCIYPQRVGRDPDAVADLVRLAELLAIPVMDSRARDSVNFPGSHPLYGTGPASTTVDVALVLENVRPWFPGQEDPPATAKIAWVDADPVQSRFKTMEFRADLWLPAHVGATVRAIYDAATGLLDKSDMSRIAERRARLERRKKEMLATEEALAHKAGKQEKPDPRWVAYQLSKVIDSKAIVLNDLVSYRAHVQHYAMRDLPGTAFSSGSSTGGWGPGAAVGAKLVAPDRDVVLVSGDGFYLFGEPLAALWAARQHQAPHLTVVFVNASYSTGTTNVQASYPDGYAMQRHQYPGGLFEPPPNFAKLAESVDCYGENVTESAQVSPALARGMEQVRKGIPAVVAVRVPNLV